MNPTVSIIIPTYNSWRSLQRAIASVQVQTFRDWELIVVDDGSTDHTGRLLVEGIIEESKMRHWTITHSGSPVVPRNFGVEKARGKWLAFLDSDDTWMPRKLEAVLAWIGGMVHQSALYYHDLLLDWGEGRRVHYWSDLSRCHSGNVMDRLLVKNFIPTSSVVIPRSLWHPMDSTLTISHDWDLWLKIARAYPVQYIPAALGSLRLHEGSVITKVRRRRAESREVVRRHRPSCPSLIAKVEATLYYYLVEVWDRWRSLRG